MRVKSRRDDEADIGSWYKLGDIRLLLWAEPRVSSVRCSRVGGLVSGVERDAHGAREKPQHGEDQ